MLGYLLGLVDPFTRIAEKLATAYAARQNATTERERIVADERIKGLEARRDVMAAEVDRFSINALMRSFIALGPTVYLLKIFVWDKVLGWGVTDRLDPNLWNVVTAVIGFYFLYEGAIGVARVVRR